jgi:hypothetical protein
LDSVNVLAPRAEELARADGIESFSITPVRL